MERTLDLLVPVLRPSVWSEAMAVSLAMTALLVAANGPVRAAMPGGSWLRMFVAVWALVGVAFFWGVGLFVSGSLFEALIRAGTHQSAAGFVAMAATAILAAGSIMLIGRIAYVRDASADYRLAYWIAAQTAWWGVVQRHAPRPPGSGHYAFSTSAPLGEIDR